MRWMGNELEITGLHCWTPVKLKTQDFIIANPRPLNVSEKVSSDIRKTLSKSNILLNNSIPQS